MPGLSGVLHGRYYSAGASQRQTLQRGSKPTSDAAARERANVRRCSVGASQRQMLQHGSEPLQRDGPRDPHLSQPVQAHVAARPPLAGLRRRVPGRAALQECGQPQTWVGRLAAPSEPQAHKFL